MGQNLSVAQKEMQRIIDQMNKHIDKAAEGHLRSTAYQIARMVYSMMDGFYHVTGNTINSVGVALYYKKKLKYIATSAEQIDNPATRKTLKAGERYNLKEYWGGAPAGKRPYVGEIGDRSFYADKMAQQMVRKNVTIPNDWTFKVVVAVPYARYLEQEKGANVITDTHELIRATGAQVTEIAAG